MPAPITITVDTTAHLGAFDPTTSDIQRAFVGNAIWRWNPTSKATASGKVLGSLTQGRWEWESETASAKPTTGTYEPGMFVRNSAPAVTGTAGSQYVVQGWIRLTSGSSHTLNTDWVESRTLTGT